MIPLAFGFRVRKKMRLCSSFQQPNELYAFVTAVLGSRLSLWQVISPRLAVLTANLIKPVMTSSLLQRFPELIQSLFIFVRSDKNPKRTSDCERSNFTTCPIFFLRLVLATDLLIGHCVNACFLFM